MLKMENENAEERLKSITVQAEVCDYFFKEWLKVKEEYSIK